MPTSSNGNSSGGFVIFPRNILKTRIPGRLIVITTVFVVGSITSPLLMRRSLSAPTRPSLPQSTTIDLKEVPKGKVYNPATGQIMDEDDPNAKAPSPPAGPRVPARAIVGDKPIKLPKIRAASAVLMDADTGEIIYEKDADAERPMASTTKIMTALLFCEHVSDDAIISASKNACKIHNCSLHLQLGEQISAHDLLRAMLIRSANDTCVAAAEQVAGSETAFVTMMNQKAVELGALRTHFANPHGLTAPDHFTTARDLAQIARSVVRQKRIMNVVKLLDCTINRTVKKSDCNLHNYSHFVGRYDGAEGLKSGWTTPSGHCYVGVASHKGWRLISVVLNTPEYGSDTTHLMDFGFTHYERVHVSEPGLPVGDAPVRDGVVKAVAAQTTDALTVVVPRGERDHIEKRLRFESPSAPITVGKVVGALDAWVGGRPVLSIPVVAAASVNAAPRIVSTAHGSRRKIFFSFTVLVAGLVSLRYGTIKRKRNRFSPFAKSSRGGRARFTAHMRDDNIFRKS